MPYCQCSWGFVGNPEKMCRNREWMVFNNKSIIEDIYNLDPWVGTEIAFELCGNNFDNQNWNQLDCNLSADENN